MIEPLVFMMGEFKAEFPSDRNYAKNHMWAIPLDSDRFRFGFSAYAVRLLQDVYFLDVDVDAGSSITARQEFGTIGKQESGERPIRADGWHGAGRPSHRAKGPFSDQRRQVWRGLVARIQGDGSELLSAQAYLEHLEAAWEVAQRTIKGQANA